MFRTARTVVSVCAAALGLWMAAAPAFASGTEPSGERIHGQSAIEPAYNDADGSIVYLQTPINISTPPASTNTNPRATAPLYLVMYPPGSTVLNSHNLNCAGVPGNCPDHDGVVAGIATQVMPGVYGHNPLVVPGHDHLVGVANSGGDFNIAWEVWEVLFTNANAANQHITTLAELDNAVKSGNAISFDLKFNFHCSIVSEQNYSHSTPI